MFFGIPMWVAATLAGTAVAVPMAVKKAKQDALRAYVESYIASPDEKDKQAIKTAALQAFAGKLLPQTFDHLVATVQARRVTPAPAPVIDVHAEPKKEETPHVAEK